MPDSMQQFLFGKIINSLILASTCNPQHR